MRFSKPIVFVLSLTPALWLLFRALTHRLSANPIEDLTLTTGVWALRLLLMTLAITPIRRITGWNEIVRYRRMLGLFAFFYACIHLSIYLVLDQGIAFRYILADIAKRRFITAGMVAFTCMVPLALTSTKGWIRRLGRRWQALHRLIYVSGFCACLHFVWKVKVVIGEPVYYAAVLGVLLGFRVLWRYRPSRRPRVQPAGA